MLADIDDEVPIPCFTRHSALVGAIVIRFLLRILCFLVITPLPVYLFAPNLPRWLLAVADAISGMCCINLLHVLLPHPPGHLPGPVPVPSLVPGTLLLPWAVWMARIPVSPLSEWFLPLKSPGCCLGPTFPVDAPVALCV
jgi:hypothetical protein